jgi:hypothetical protein
MSDTCCCPPEAGNIVCELPPQDFQRPTRIANACPVCGRLGKPVQGQTVKALLSTSLREVRDVEYLFCREPSCSVVYFSADREQTFTIDQIRERVYQKEPRNPDVLVCYCFQHTVSELNKASPERRLAIVEDINSGIRRDQCACDLRNPQGSCCLGNVRELARQLEKTA